MRTGAPASPTVVTAGGGCAIAAAVMLALSVLGYWTVTGGTSSSSSSPIPLSRQPPAEGASTLYAALPSTGVPAKDLDLWEYRELHRNHFHTALQALSVSPHAATAVMRLWGGTGLDGALFGAGMASPWSWPLWFVAPGLLAIRYLVALWWDSNSVAVLLLASGYVFADVAWWVALAQAAFTQKEDRWAGVRRIARRGVQAVVFGTFYSVLLYPVTPTTLTDVALYIWMATAPFVAFVEVVGVLCIVVVGVAAALAARRNAGTDSGGVDGGSGGGGSGSGRGQLRQSSMQDDPNDSTDMQSDALRRGHAAVAPHCIDDPSDDFEVEP